MSGCRIQNKVGIYWSNVDDNKEIDQPIMDTAGHKKSRISDKILDASFLSKSSRQAVNLWFKVQD